MDGRGLHRDDPESGVSKLSAKLMARSQPDAQIADVAPSQWCAERHIPFFRTLTKHVCGVAS
jgi:hypothetical protein